MAKIVLRTNIANKNLEVEHKVLDTRDIDNAVEVIISPRPGYSINASDFTTGYLPDEINDIKYVNYGDDKVKAIISLCNDCPQIINPKSNINISLPISGITTVLEDNFTLVEACAGDDDVNVIINGSSSYSSSVNTGGGTFHDCGDGHVSDVKTYSIKNTLGTKTLVLNKKFITPDNYYFPNEPTYTITGNRNRYTVVSKLHKDKDNRITYKNFDVYYTSPEKSTITGNTDTICFSAKTATTLDKNLEEGKSLRDKEATKQEEYKIYSINTGENISAKGGIKKIEVKGVPGTPFRIITQNNAKETYNYKTGEFETGGGMLSGIIPPARAHVNYGTYTTFVKIKKSGSSDTVTTRLITDNVVDHTAITDSISQSRKIKSDNKLIPNTTLTFTAASTGISTAELNLSKPDLGKASTITIGPGRFKEGLGVGVDGNPIDTLIFNIQCTSTADSKGLYIVRQPRHKLDAVYYNWDSSYASECTKGYNSAGKQILTDWDVSGNGNTPDNNEASYSISTVATGRGQLGSTTDSCLSEVVPLYQFVDLKITISSVQFGDADVTPELDLLNFLTLASI